MQQHTAGGCNTLQGSALCHRLAKDAQFEDAASVTTNSVKLVVGRTGCDNVDTMWQKSTKKIKDIRMASSKLKRVASEKFTRRNPWRISLVSMFHLERPAGHWKFTCFPQQHQSTHVKPAVANISSNRFMPPPVKWKVHSWWQVERRSISCARRWMYMNVIFMLLQAYLECTFFHMWHPFFQFVSTFKLHLYISKVSRWLSPTSSYGLGLSRSPGHIQSRWDFDTVKMVLP